MSITITELDYSLSELNVAIKDHYNWAAKLLRLGLIGGEAENDIMNPRSHQHCRFSAWLTLRREGNALDREMIREIENYHTLMHDVARELMQSILIKSVTAELLTLYSNSQQAFIDSLGRYKDYLFNYRNLHDALTGLPLRHLLYQDFPIIQTQCKDMEQGLYVLIMDIDRFKLINDTWGHNIGDDVLRTVATTLRDATRNNERIYRFGGEEFITLLNAPDDKSAQKAASRMRLHLERHPIMGFVE
ncbi:diguanylate cyclase [Scandinavium sp. TWS1a]|uniref:diguanylate cyclase domain-containing protein n=1 Tax=Scandinavium tedordense TaxID=2926521 RepID=UPI00216540A2|nr:diguanylate cyclase [Scandinavium tedordense]MCS2168972.1 diguanylate cyclase [Scandinavium tedordense]